MSKTATQWMIEPLRKYAAFGGRARRKEYWWFALFTFLISLPLAVGDFLVLGPEAFAEYGIGPLTGLAGLATLVPSLAVAVRRLHDTERSGWWLLLSLLPIVGFFVLIFWFCSRGTIGPNRFGDDPVID